MSVGVGVGVGVGTVIQNAADENKVVNQPEMPTGLLNLGMRGCDGRQAWEEPRSRGTCKCFPQEGGIPGNPGKSAPKVHERGGVEEHPST